MLFGSMGAINFTFDIISSKTNNEESKRIKIITQLMIHSKRIQGCILCMWDGIIF